MSDVPRPARIEPEPDGPTVGFDLNGSPVRVPDVGDTLLGALRGSLGIGSAKDGCSPQGQCGCCTVLVDGQARVACVTPVRRVAGRAVTTLEGLPVERQERWARRFCETGGSQCGFCTPGIIMRLDGLEQKAIARDGATDLDDVRQALLAHLCRCTGWQTILEAWQHDGVVDDRRDLGAAARRAEIEGGASQQVGPAVALGAGGFAADTVPNQAVVAVPSGRTTDTEPATAWTVGADLREARAAAGKIQGRRSTAGLRWPIEVPEGRWAATLQTTWVEPAYLETDASWCVPGGQPASPLANGGAFGAKRRSPTVDAARAEATARGETVVALFGREDAVRLGPKRPPLAAGIRADGTGVVRVAASPGIESMIAAVAPGMVVETVSIPGPPVSSDLRAAGWAEMVALLAACRSELGPVRAPNGAVARAELVDGVIRVSVRCGRVLDEVVLRSYCIGAAHMAYSWVMSEGLTVDAQGEVHDLTIRSFGIVRAVDTPPIEVELVDDDTEPINGSDAVFAAVAAATWMHAGFAPRWPVGAMMAT